MTSFDTKLINSNISSLLHCINKNLRDSYNIDALSNATKREHAWLIQVSNIIFTGHEYKHFSQV